MHGVEIVAFVSSVGKINIPASVGGRSVSHDEDDDEVEDALTPEFRELLHTVTREMVDKQPTRCPHPETAERMTKVLPVPFTPNFTIRLNPTFFSESFAQRRRMTQLAVPLRV